MKFWGFYRECYIFNDVCLYNSFLNPPLNKVHTMIDYGTNNISSSNNIDDVIRVGNFYYFKIVIIG